jgi:hypothetical protein
MVIICPYLKCHHCNINEEKNIIERKEERREREEGKKGEKDRNKRSRGER